jgi:hypothetical protein
MTTPPRGKTQPQITIINGYSGPLETTYVTPAPSFFRFNIDGQGALTIAIGDHRSVPVQIGTPLASSNAILEQIISLYAHAVRSELRQRVTSLEPPFDQVSTTPE